MFKNNYRTKFYFKQRLKTYWPNSTQTFPVYNLAKSRQSPSTVFTVPNQRLKIGSRFTPPQLTGSYCITSLWLLIFALGGRFLSIKTINSFFLFVLVAFSDTLFVRLVLKMPQKIACYRANYARIDYASDLLDNHPWSILAKLAHRLIKNRR